MRQVYITTSSCVAHHTSCKLLGTDGYNFRDLQLKHCSADNPNTYACSYIYISSNPP